jgi:hypothetical protein
VLKVFGKTADVIFGTNFLSLTHSTDQLQWLDNMQYEACVKLQTIKDEFRKEGLEATKEQILVEMVKLINQSGTLPPDVVKQLVVNGILDPSQTQTNTIIAPATETPAKVVNADDVPVPILPVPKSFGGWEDAATFPCEVEAMSSAGVIRASGMESSMDPQIPKSIANLIALEELASKIEVTVKSTTQYFVDRTEVNLKESELTTRFESKIEKSVEQTIRGYRTICEKRQQHSETQQWRCFVALEINEDAVLKPIHDELTKDPELRKAVPSYKKFKDTFDEGLKFYEKVGD